MNLKKLLPLSAGLLVAAGANTAFADDEAAAAADATVTTGGGEAGMDANATAGGGASGGMVAGFWTKEQVTRPLVLRKGKLGAYGNLYSLRFSSPPVPPATTGTSATAEGLLVGAGYGVTDKITAGANYAFSLHDFEIKGPLTLYGNMELVNDGKLSVAASASLLINLGGSSTTETILAGLGVRYLVAPKIIVFTGGGSFPGTTLSFGDAYGPLAGSPSGQHLSIGLNDPAPIGFDIPVGAGFQATPELYVGVSTSIGHIGIKDSDSAFFGADFIPLNVGALFNVNNNIDAGAFILLPDLKEIQFDLTFIGIGARYYN